MDEVIKKKTIPKKIHYCWFGRGKKNTLFYKCLNSWKKYYPDFEIIEWNENNYDVMANIYTKEAYDNKKWAFVSDYARLKILYDEGGIYFDTDVEAIKRIDDKILETGYFAKETEKVIATGLGFGVYPKNKIVKYMMDDYNDKHFLRNDGTFDLTPCPKRNTNSLINRGYLINGKTSQIDNIRIYGPEYFCGYDVSTQSYLITDNTYTIHHYKASWLPWYRRALSKIKREISKIIGPNTYTKIGNIIHNRK